MRSWYRQTLRWLHGTMQGVRGHRIGRRLSRFSMAYLALILDWVLYVAVWPVLLTAGVWHAVQTDRLALVLAIYFGGYVLWSVVGAFAVRNWRLVLLSPWLVVMDWAQRAVFIHGAIKAIVEPTSDCRWESPARVATASASSSGGGGV